MRTKPKQVRQKCIAVTMAGQPCSNTAVLGSTVCKIHQRPHRHGTFGIYTKHLSSAMRTIYDQLSRDNKLEELKRSDLEEEIAVARLQLAALLKDEEAPPGLRLRAIETVGKIAKTAKLIHEIDSQVLRQEFLQSLIEAVTFAFHRANTVVDPGERAKVFLSELSQFFPATDGPALLEAPNDDMSL